LRNIAILRKVELLLVAKRRDHHLVVGMCRQLRGTPYAKIALLVCYGDIRSSRELLLPFMIQTTVAQRRIHHLSPRANE
jgi:hypothetical protein